MAGTAPDPTGAAPATEATGRPQAPRRFRADIQGLRALAVGLVVLYHCGVPGLSGGFVGVDVFFVISGYLITTHLLESLARDGRVSFADFYARRVRRILPASFAVLVATVAAAVIWVPPLQLRAVLTGAIATAAYVPNYLFAVQGTDYLADAEPSLFQHYWSLGIEEQFYLLWPALLAAGFWAVRRSERRLVWVAVAVAVVSLAWCITLTTASQPWAFFSLHTRAWELAAGGILAFAVRPRARAARPAGPPVRGLGAVAGWAGLGLLAWVAVTFDSTVPYPGWHALLPVAASVLIIAGGTPLAGAAPARGGPTALLSLAPLQGVGLVSYSLYLVHWPLLTIPQAAVGAGTPLPLGVRLALGAASVPLAYALFRWVEDPARRSRLARARPRRSLLLAGAASAAVVALSAGGLVLAERSLARGEGAAVAAQPPSTTVRGADVVPANLTPSLADAASDVPVIYADGCHRDDTSTDASGCLVGQGRADDGSVPRVALFGDSHAAQWFPALAVLAEAGEIVLDSNTKNSCPPAAVPVVIDGVPYTSCDTWRDGVLERFAGDPPDVVVLAGYARSPYLTGAPDMATAWADGLTRTIAALPASTHVVVLTDTPVMAENPALCLSAHLDDAGACGRARAGALDPAVRVAESDAARAGGARFADLSDYLCSPEQCPAVIGADLVYRDAHHLSATYAAALAPAVRAAVLGAALPPEGPPTST
ncbi:MAG: acyltransferase family protein [Cellulomonadaceae bacterium]